MAKGPTRRAGHPFWRTHILYTHSGQEGYGGCTPRMETLESTKSAVTVWRKTEDRERTYARKTRQHQHTRSQPGLLNHSQISSSFMKPRVSAVDVGAA